MVQVVTKLVQVPAFEEFPDSFVDDLAGLPPVQEVVSTIN